MTAGVNDGNVSRSVTGDATARSTGDTAGGTEQEVPAGSQSGSKMATPPAYGRLAWASRRGMRELDLMLLPFVEHDLPKLDAEDLAAYQDLLEATDLELLHWLSGSKPADSESRRRIVDLIRHCHAGRLGREGV